MSNHDDEKFKIAIDDFSERLPSNGDVIMLDETPSLRDYFAARAVQGLLSCPAQPQSGVDMYARDAYAIADAMLAERTK